MGMSSRTLRLFVGRVPWAVSRKVLKDYFSKFGEVRSAVVMFDKKTGRHRGYGFVDFKDKDSFNAAISKDSHVLENSRLLLAEGQQRTAGKQQPLSM